jgi:hypothetical protein
MRRRGRTFEKIRRTGRRRITVLIIGRERWEERNEGKEGRRAREDEENKTNAVVALWHCDTVLLKRSPLHNRLAYSWWLGSNMDKYEVEIKNSLLRKLSVLAYFTNRYPYTYSRPPQHQPQVTEENHESEGIQNVSIAKSTPKKSSSINFGPIAVIVSC